MNKPKVTTGLYLMLSIVFIAAVVWTIVEINNLKFRNMKLELLLMSDRQDYSRSFVIFQRLKNLADNMDVNETGDNDRILLEAKYESVILNSNYNVFPDFRSEKNFMQRFIRHIDKKIDPELYEKIEERSIRSEKYMELAFFMEANKSYADAVRYYTVFLEKNDSTRHDYFNIALLHLAFCYLMNGYPENAETLARSVLAFSKNKVITGNADFFLDYLKRMSLQRRYREAGDTGGRFLESGLRYYAIFNYNKAILSLSKYLHDARAGRQGDVLRAWYFIARSYEETGRYSIALDIYRRILALGDENPYREKALKRILLLNYVYRIPIDDLDKIISDSRISIDGRLMNEINEISIIGRDLAGTRKMRMSESAALDNEIKNFLNEKTPGRDPVLNYFLKFDNENSETLGKDDEVRQGIVTMESTVTGEGTVKGKDPGMTGFKSRKVKIFLKDNSELVGDLEMEGKDIMRLRVFGNRVDVKKGDISKWEYVQ